MSLPRPKKRFSQNFLIDKSIAEKIVGLLNIQKRDIVFEIGPGRGILTGIIARTGAELYAFEIDRTLIDNLKKKFIGCDNVTIVNQDFLRVMPSDYTDGRFKLIGNIPYDITSPLLDWIIQYKDRLDRAVITAQKELADRISSGPGSKNWAAVSIFTQVAFRVHTSLTINPEAFYPRPKIKSATMVFEPIDEYKIPDLEVFRRIVKAAFGQRRKRLVNNLANLPGFDKERIEKIIGSLEWDKNIRAEQISIDDFIRLSKIIASANIS